MNDVRQAQIVVGFMGTREGMTLPQKEAVFALLERLDPAVVHHGCGIGADAEFDKFLESRFTITTSDQPLWISLDGEVVSGKSPLQFESKPGALRVLVPADSPAVRGAERAKI